MAISFGKTKLLKEFEISIDKNGLVEGFLDLVWKGKIKVEGKLESINDVDLYEPFGPLQRTEKSLNLLPIKLHFKTKQVVGENDNIYEGITLQHVTPKEFLENFGSIQKIHAIQISICDSGFTLSIVARGTPCIKWRASVWLKDIEILESKNVPGLPDVVRKI